VWDIGLKKAKRKGKRGTPKTAKVKQGDGGKTIPTLPSAEKKKWEKSTCP